MTLRTVRELVPDPERPNATIVRHRRYCAFRAMAGKARGSERDAWPARLEAVEFYALALEVVQGAKPGANENVGRSNGAFRWEVSEVVLRAADLAMRVDKALGRQGAEVLCFLALVDGATVKEVARRYRWSSSLASQQIVALLDRLVDVVG